MLYLSCIPVSKLSRIELLYNELIIYFFLCHSVGIKLIKLVPQNFYSTYSLQLTLGLMYFKLVKAINLKLNVLVTHTHTHKSQNKRKGLQGTLGGVRNVCYLDCSDGVTGVCICSNYSHCAH